MRSGDAGERSARLRPNGRWVRFTSSEQRTGQPNAVDVSGSESQIRGLGGPVQTLAADFRFRPQTDSTAARAGGNWGISAVLLPLALPSEMLKSQRKQFQCVN